MRCRGSRSKDYTDPPAHGGTCDVKALSGTQVLGRAVQAQIRLSGGTVVSRRSSQKKLLVHRNAVLAAVAQVMIHEPKDIEGLE